MPTIAAYPDMSRIPRYGIVNLVLFNLGWLACIQGAARGVPLLGVFVVLVLGAFHLVQSKDRRSELTLFLVAPALGYLLDSAVVLGGFVSIPEQARLGQPATIWLVFMWANFGTSLTSSLGWLRGKLLLGIVFGLVGGPLAYFAGSKLGAIELQEKWWIAVGVEWGIAMPILSGIAQRLTRRVKSESD